jgi:hypothetical protein
VQTARASARPHDRTSTPSSPGEVVNQYSQPFPPTAVQQPWRYSVASALVASAMASGFIGISVVVTLQNPPNTLVHGVVAAVNPQNATLTLQDGMSHVICRRRYK